MAKIIRKLLTEIDKKFKESEEVSFIIRLILIISLTIGYTNDQLSAVETRECTYSEHERKVRVRDEKGDQEVAEDERLLQDESKQP